MVILPRSGGKIAILGYFLKIESVQKVIDYTLKMKKPTAQVGNLGTTTKLC